MIRGLSYLYLSLISILVVIVLGVFITILGIETNFIYFLGIIILFGSYLLWLKRENLLKHKRMYLAYSSMYFIPLPTILLVYFFMLMIDFVNVTLLYVISIAMFSIITLLIVKKKNDLIEPSSLGYPLIMLFVSISITLTLTVVSYIDLLENGAILSFII